MKESASILLSLLRSAIGSKPVDCDLTAISSEEWNRIIDFSFDQGVDAISVDGYNSISGTENCLLESDELEDLRLDWFGSVLQAEADYQKFTKTISSLAKLFAKNGIKMMVLKGYGLSQDYPIPEHRTLGDIDIFLYDGNMPLTGPNPAAWKGDEILRSIGCNVDTDNPHHSQIRYKGLTIENHHFILDNDMHLSNGKVERRLRELLRWDRTIEMEGASVYLPSVTFGALHLLRHSGGDFCSSGTSLRQVLDWGLFIKAHHDEIDFPELIRSAKEFNMIRWMGCLSAICVDYLGMDAGLFPCVEGDRKLVGRIVDDIFRPEFQGEIPPMKQLVGYGLAKTRRMVVNRWKYGLVYEEGVIRSWWGLGVNRVKQTSIRK